MPGTTFQVAGLKPYVGGGIGWADVEVDGVYQGKTVGASFSESGFAWQLGGGLHLPIDEKLTLGIGYRYFSGSGHHHSCPYSGQSACRQR
jgi:opacity protein-like surface antigen